VACDSYHHLEEDVQLLKDLGVNAYRFSISWSRIFPYGHNDHLNVKGIEHYNKLIDLLIQHQIEPVVTLYHWDLPQSLENDYQGLLHSTNFQQDFIQFAKICFESFGDRVKKWITVNEPWTISALGYGLGIFAPGRCSYRERCLEGNSSIESYMVAHNLLNAHAAVVDLYRKQFKPLQRGLIGITLNHDWAEPYDASNPLDQMAAEHRREFQLGWFADPIFFGKYPQSMINLIGNERLPKFTDEQSKLLKGSIDFLGLNHYTSKYYLFRDQDDHGECWASINNITSRDEHTSGSKKRKYPKDIDIKQLERDFRRNGGSGWYDDQCTYETKYALDGTIIGVQAESPWLNVVPWGFYKLLKWVDNRYYHENREVNIPIYITENGCDVPNEAKMSKRQILKDSFR
jgi:beta-glucosidase